MKCEAHVLGVRFFFGPIETALRYKEAQPLFMGR